MHECIAAGLGQLVIIGAGFDTRAYRFEEVKENLKVFEVDHPVTQQIKVETIKEIFGALPDHVVCVPVVLGADRLDRRLLENGYEPKLKTLFIVEGLLMDLKMQNVTYRRACNRDSEVIKYILKDTFEEYGINLPGNYSFSDIENLEEEYLNLSGEFIVLIKKHNIIGFFALLPSHNNQIELKRLYLIASQRGKGLGKHLLTMALRIAKKTGNYRIHLETTSKFIEAVALYRKFGFVKNVEAKLAQGHDIGLVMDLSSTDLPA